MPKAKPISLHSLTFEQVIDALIKVDPLKKKKPKRKAKRKQKR